MPLSRYNTALTEDGLRTMPEGQYFERKGRDTKPGKIANERIGMLNAGGGILAYGMGDDGTVEDLQKGSLLPDAPLDLDRYRKLVHEFIKPPANIELEEIYLEGGELIFLYHVDQDYERLFARADNEAVYLRVAADNKGPLNRDEVKKLEYNKAIRSYEDESREDFDRAAGGLPASRLAGLLLSQHGYRALRARAGIPQRGLAGGYRQRALPPILQSAGQLDLY